MFKCIRCEKPIPETVKDRRPTDLVNINFVDGIVEKISIGYGSRHNLKTIVVGICDDCIDNLMEKDIIKDYSDLLDEKQRRGGKEDTQIFRAIRGIFCQFRNTNRGHNS